MGCVEREAPSERAARIELEHVLGRALDRVYPDGRPSADYTAAVSDGLPIAVEVKEVASQEWLQLQAGLSREQSSIDTDRLTFRWHVLLEADPVASRLTAPPKFPDDDEASIARLESRGFKVQRQADRIAEWRQQMAAPRRPVRVKNLLADLIPDLQILERHGVTDTRGADLTEHEVRVALARIGGRTNGAICMVRPTYPDRGVLAGVEITSVHGWFRTTDPNTVAERVQAWLDSELSSNLVESLDRPEYGERHGVLVFNGLEPELQSAVENPASFVPTVPLDLPGPVQVIWCLLGPVLLRFSIEDGWQRFDRVGWS